MLRSLLCHPYILEPCICNSQVVEDFGLLRFTPLAVEDKHSMRALLRHIDKANGYALTGLPDTEPPFSAAALTGATFSLGSIENTTQSVGLRVSGRAITG